jgi:uncharacterized protein (DUF924 family)
MMNHMGMLGDRSRRSVIQKRTQVFCYKTRVVEFWRPAKSMKWFPGELGFRDDTRKIHKAVEQT